MKFYFGAASIAAVSITLLLAGTGPGDHFYAIPVDRVREVVDDAALPMMVFGARAATAKHWRLNKDTSLWALTSADGVELLRLSVATIAEGDKTRIHYGILPPESALHDQVAQGLKENAAYSDLYRSALAEQIDAQLTNREFSIVNISGAAALVTIQQLPNIKAGMDQAEAEYQKQTQDIVDRAYAEEGRTR